MLKPRKIRSIYGACLIPVQSKTAQAALLRIVTGDGCEVSSCYQMATWVLALNDVSYHLCAKHTKIKMRDATLWGNTDNARIES